MSMLRTSLAIFLGLVLYIIIGLQSYSASGFWELYKPWFGEPVEVEYCHEINGDYNFTLRLNNAQRQEWIDTFQLQYKAASSADFHTCVSSKHPVTLTGAESNNTYNIRLTRLYNTEARDRYELSLEQVYPEHMDSSEMANFEDLKVEKKREIASSKLTRHFIPLLFLACIVFLPAVMARLVVKKRESCFAFKELFLNYFTTGLFYVAFNFIFTIALYIFGSFAPDGLFFWVIGGLLAGPFVCAFSSFTLYIIIGISRWLKLRKQEISQNI